MKATELRIGNLVYGYKTVWSIDSTDFCNIGVIETYKPIPLTEGWLLKFGFKGSGGEYYGNNFYGILKNEKGYWLDDLDTGINSKPIKYVHQLQNLYFTITGEELKIK